MLLKYLLFIYFKPNIEELLRNKFEEFWNYRHIDEGILIEKAKIYKFTELVQTSIVAIGLAAISLYYLRPILTENNPFPFPTWVSGVIVVDVTGLACQHYFFIFGLSVVFGYDGIYLCLCIQTVVQSKLLSNRMQHFQESFERDAGYYIKCHQLLLR